MKKEEAMAEIDRRRKVLQKILNVKEKLINREEKDDSFFKTYDVLVMAEYEQLIHIEELQRIIKEKSYEE